MANRLSIRVLVIIILLLLLTLIKPISASLKVLLLLSQEFPQIPLKTLHFVTQKPKVEKIKFGSDKKIVGDLFIPNSPNKNPALVIAMGVKTSEKDKPTILGFSNTLARLGFVVLWPRLEDLEKDNVKIEEQKTFIDSFLYLKDRKEVNKDRISFVGFSVGSSTALTAAEDKAISEQLHSLIFFGGYYNIIDYLYSLSVQKTIADGQTVSWQPHESAINHIREILEKEGLKLEQFANKDAIPKATKNNILNYSPHQKIGEFKAPIFILHDVSDSFVPYTESLKLKDALEGKVPVVYYQSNLFEHVKPKKGIPYEMAKEFLGLFGFLFKVFMYL